MDGHTRLACTEALPDEKAETAIGFVNRAKAFFAAHGITRIERIVTDNGACYRRSFFEETNLTDVLLIDADVKPARTSFRSADLTGADLRGADLRGARLSGARLAGAKVDAKTKGLPDAAR